MAMKMVRNTYKAEDIEYTILMESLKLYAQKKEHQGTAEALKAQGMVEVLRGGLNVVITSVSGNRLT